MPGATEQSVGQILQDKYLPGIKTQFNKDYPNLRYIRQNSRDIDAQGEKAVMAIELGLNEGGGFHGESADVAASGYPLIKRTEVSLKQLTFRARITYRLMKKAKSKVAAFARGVQLQMESTREAFILRANTYLWGDGTGVLARVQTSDAAAGTITLDRMYGLASGGSPAGVIRPGMRLHILDTKTFEDGVSTDRGYGRVAATDDSVAGELTVRLRAGHGFELDPATTGGVTAGDYVFLENTIQGWLDPGEVDDNRPAMGLLGFYDADLVPVLQGLDVADEPQWAGKEITADQTNASTLRSSFRKGKHALSKENRRGRVQYLISAYEPYETYAGALDETLEFRNVRTVDGDFEVGSYMGRPWFLDHTAPQDRVFFVPTGDIINRYAADDFINFVTDGGGRMNLVPNKTVFDSLITALYEYGITRRNVLVQVTNMN